MTAPRLAGVASATCARSESKTPPSALLNTGMIARWWSCATLTTSRLYVVSSGSQSRKSRPVPARLRCSHSGIRWVRCSAFSRSAWTPARLPDHVEGGDDRVARRRAAAARGGSARGGRVAAISRNSASRLRRARCRVSRTSWPVTHRAPARHGPCASAPGVRGRNGTTSRLMTKIVVVTPSASPTTVPSRFTTRRRFPVGSKKTCLGSAATHGRSRCAGAEVLGPRGASLNTRAAAPRRGNGR